MTFGSYPNDFTLSEARTQRDMYLKGIVQGKDPKIIKNTKAEERIVASQHTIESIYNAVVKERTHSTKNKWSKSHIRRVGFTWEHLKPIANIPIAELTKKRLREILVSINHGIGASTGDKCKAPVHKVCWLRPR